MTIVDRIRQRFATQRPELDRAVSVNPIGLVRDAYLDGYNPDQLVRTKGGVTLGLKVYREMRRHAAIRPLLAQKKNDLIAAGWRVDAASDDERDVEAAAFVKWNLGQLAGSWGQTQRQIMSAIEFGYSITEKVWGVATDGAYRGNVMLVRLATRVPENFRFKVLPDGTLKGNAITQVTPVDDFPADKFLVYSYQKEFDNWFGESDLRSAYEPYWSLQIIHKFWNMYLERFGMPTAVGKYPVGISEAKRADIETMLKRIQGATSITIPVDLEFELHEIAGRGAQAYRDAVDKREAQITKALLFPPDTGMGGADPAGSRARAQVQARGFLPAVLILVEDHEALVNEQLIPQLVLLNYAVDEMPKYHVNDLAFEDTAGNVATFMAAADKGLVHGRPEDEVYIREATGFPAVDIDELKSAEEEDEGSAKASEIEDELGEKWTFGGPGSGPRPGHGKKMSRAERARASHKPSTKEKQRAGIATEKRVAEMIGGTHLKDHEPMDLIAGGGKIGVEVKTFLDNAHDKVTMHPDAHARKTAWMKKNKAKVFTVVVDGRDKFGGGVNKGSFSGHRIYARAGVGSFRLGAMTKIDSPAALKSFVGA